MIEMLILVAGSAQPAATPSIPIPPPAAQITVAVQAAPEDRRERAIVLGYDAAGALVTLRPVEGGPWLMFPGTPTAHIMISPRKTAK